MSRGVRRNALVEASEGQEVKKGDLLFVSIHDHSRLTSSKRKANWRRIQLSLVCTRETLSATRRSGSFLFSGSPNQVFQ
jgi:hypothetical protein